MENGNLILFVAREIKTNNPILIEGKELTKQMTLAAANAYYRQIAVNKPSQSYFAPAENSGYIYDKASNSLVKNEPVVAEPVAKTTAKKVSEPTV
jgi:hypothetical protein